MGGVVIRAEGLGKQFHIGARVERYATLRDRIADVFSRRNGSRKAEPFWALRDVSFEVKRGEVLGIIGRNGAGKSTLLKILSRITEPTCGWAEIRGRVGSLLEVGTGFHPELTGRENVYLNGAILGMKRAEIGARFDEIVAFAEVEKFIDTPVKHYSSGMYLRLAFAVAAHLEPEILVIDEVLAVGDAGFQQRCLGKMKAVATGGRTVLFVSHDMHAVEQLCTRALLLVAGEIAGQGSPAEIIPGYLGLGCTNGDGVAFMDPAGRLSVDMVYAAQRAAAPVSIVDGRTPFEIIIEYSIHQEIAKLLLGFDLVSETGVHVLRTYDLQSAGMGVRAPGRYVSTCRLPGGLLQPGRYAARVLAGIHRRLWMIKGEIGFGLAVANLRETDVDYPGLLTEKGEWQVCQAEEKSACVRDE